MKVDVDHPDELEELAILQRMSVDPPRAREVLTPSRCWRCRRRPTRSSCTTRWRSTPSQLVVATRAPAALRAGQVGAALEFGVSPRATLGLVAAARALALLRGRDYVLPRDVADVAADVLAHRLVLSFDAVAEGVDPRQVVGYLLAAVPPPQVAPHEDRSPTSQRERSRREVR